MIRKMKEILEQEKIAIMLVGPPLVGKSTWIRENIDLDRFKIISRDDLLLQVAGTDDYSIAWKKASQGQVNKLLTKTMIDANNNGDSVVIDMTNMAPKRRITTMNMFDDDYFKVAVVFPFLDDEEYKRRNAKRFAEENKDIPMMVVKRMQNSYRTPTKEEGFDVIINL